MTRPLLLALALAVLGGAGAYLFSGSQPNATPGFAVGMAEAQQAGEVDTSGVVEMALGAEDAPVTVIEYASYTCPHCATFHAGPLKQLKADYVDTGKVRFIYREVYFDRFGLWASMVARCGGAQRFFGISDLIYNQQREWTQGEPAQIADSLRRIGKTAGLSEAEVDACLQDGDKAQALVAWYQQNANADDISSTPSFVIDGQKYGNMSYSEFKDIIDGKLDS